MGTLAEMIRAAREKAEMSQLEVGQAVGHRDGQAVYRWEAGKSVPDAARLPKLIEVLGLDETAAKLAYIDFQITQAQARAEDQEQPRQGERMARAMRAREDQDPPEQHPGTHRAG